MFFTGAILRSLRKFRPNMKRFIKNLFITLLIIFPHFADALEIAGLVEQIQKTYEKADDLSMSFVQKTYVALLEREVQKKGEAQFKKPGKFVIHYAGGRGRNYVSNGKKLWIYESGDQAVSVTDLSQEGIPPEALSFLGGLGNLKKDFAVEEVDPKKAGTLKKEKSSLEWLELTPKQKRSSIRWLVMGFNPKTYLVEEMFLYNDSENLSHYVFDKIMVNQGLSDKIFEYSR